MDVKTLCLGALTMGDATGYEIRKLFDEGPFGQFYDAGYGSIYPALNTLLKEGLVSVTQMAQEKRPDKKVYRLTDNGMAVFKRALAEPPTKDRFRSEHIVRLFFADYMSRDDLEAVYQSYLDYFQEHVDRLRTMETEFSGDGRLFTMKMGLSFYEMMTTYLAENRDKLFEDHARNQTSDETEAIKQQGMGDD